VSKYEVEAAASFRAPVRPGDAVTLPEAAEERKRLPMVSGLLDYFPAALAAVAEVSRVGNDQHNPGQLMHWSRGKSNDHADCIVRHLVDRGARDTDLLRHSAKVAWRALALLQEELEAAGAPIARGSREPVKGEG
jgi:dATP/dGTP diphosphohydrolase